MRLTHGSRDEAQLSISCRRGSFSGDIQVPLNHLSRPWILQAELVKVIQISKQVNEEAGQ